MRKSSVIVSPIERHVEIGTDEHPRAGQVDSAGQVLESGNACGRGGLRLAHFFEATLPPAYSTKSTSRLE